MTQPTSPGAGGALWIVPSDRHVERWAREGRRVETRAGFCARLFDELVRDRSLATLVEARLALAEVLPEVAARDALLAALGGGKRGGRERGEAWERTLDAIDAALGALRTAAVPPDSLARVGREGQGGVGSRARMLVAAMRAVDALLAARGLLDPRGMGSVLAERIATHPASRVASVVGAKGVIARFVLGWDGADVAWWRALDTALVRAGGEGTRAELPSFEERIDLSRERGPLDVVSEDVARALDAPPRGIAIDAPLGDLRLAGALPTGAIAAVECRAATDAEAQARAVLGAVRRALLQGSGPEEIAITAGELDDVAVAALRRAFDEERIPLYDARGEAPATAGVVSFALGALAIGERGLRRLDVAALARSRYVAPEQLGADARGLTDLARALERTATAVADDPRGALDATARRSAATLNRGRLTPEQEALVAETRGALALRLADVVLPAARPMNRLEHAAGARALFAMLGIDPLRGRGTSALASDGGARDVVRAELRALARDAHAWELLGAALSDYEAAAVRLGLAGAAVSPRAFRHELAHTLDARAGRPGGARAGAVRVAELGELAAERLALLVVIDANDGALPSRGGEGESLLHDGLTGALRSIDPVRSPPSSTLRASRELTALALAAANARSIVLTRRSRDEEGAALAASPVVAWLERGGVRSSIWRASPLDGPAVTAHEALLRRVASGEGESGGDADRARTSLARRARVERAREARFEMASPPADPILGDLDEGGPLHPELAAALVAETGGADRPLAVTSLERFAMCAFQGFAAQVLHARPERPLRELPDRRESGTLIHRALAAAFTATGPLWSERPRRAALIHEQALAATEAILQEESVASPLRRLALARVRDAVRAVVTWSLADETWDFLAAERTFGDARGLPGDAWPALLLDDGGVRLALRGAIDRIDVGHGRAAVRAIDYKSSPRAAESGMRALGETAFQVALYARVAADALASAERAGLYVGATRPDDVGPKLKQAFEASWAALHVRAAGGATPIETKALDVVRRVRQGGVPPRPKQESACATCDACGGCRKPRFAIARDDEESA